MLLASITVGIIAVGLIAYIAGAILVSKYAFRISTLQGLLVLLLPPYTFYFAFWKLHEDDKSTAVATWAFGFVVTILLSVVFWPMVQALVQGNWAALKAPAGPGAAVAAEGSAEAGADGDSESAEEEEAAEEESDSESGEENAEGSESDSEAESGDSESDDSGDSESAESDDGESEGS
jgi:F0F1-type ATP synthase assembly protein I